MPRDANYCVLVSRMNPRTMRAFERGLVPKVAWNVIGARCFVSKAAQKRYLDKINRFRAGRARVTAEPTDAKTARMYDARVKR